MKNDRTWGLIILLKFFSDGWGRRFFREPKAPPERQQNRGAKQTNMPLKRQKQAKKKQKGRRRISIRTVPKHAKNGIFTPHKKNDVKRNFFWKISPYPSDLLAETQSKTRRLKKGGNGNKLERKEKRFFLKNPAEVVGLRIDESNIAFAN